MAQPDRQYALSEPRQGALRFTGWPPPNRRIRPRLNKNDLLGERPDNVSMAAVALAIGSGGALHSLETAVLMTVDGTIDPAQGAEGIHYQAPGA